MGSGRVGDRVSTKRAGGMGLKPHIDAFDMEPMVAFWKQAGFVAGDDLGQADCTFQAILELFGAEVQYGYGGKNGGVEASAHSGQSWVLAGGEDEAAAAATAVGAASVNGSPPEPFGVEVEKENKDNDEEEDDDGNHHNPAAEFHRRGVIEGVAHHGRTKTGEGMDEIGEDRKEEALKKRRRTNWTWFLGVGRKIQTKESSKKEEMMREGSLSFSA